MPNTFDAYEAYQRARDFFIQWRRRSVEYIKFKFQERQAKKQNEPSQDRAAQRTANATYWIAAFTLISVAVNIGVFLVLRSQLNEMHDAGVDSKRLIDANVKLASAAQKSANTADENLIATQRAWVGSIDAAIIKSPNMTPIKGTVSYVNSGKEPARILASAMEYLYTRNEWDDGTAVNAIIQHQQECLNISSIVGFRFAWPTSGFTSYLIHFPEGHIPQKGVVGWTDRISQGEDLLAVQGCIVYEAFKTIHHTAFCYFFDGKTSDMAHLNICTVGNYVN